MTEKRKRRRKLPWRVITWVWIAVVVILILIASRYVDAADSPAALTDVSGLEQATMPSGADCQTCAYTGFTSYFSPQLHIPLCVVYELTAQETAGAEPRYNGNFLTDENVAGCPSHQDYTYSGYDRGHMAPAGDMKWSQTAMLESFYLTNVCPQAKSLNTGQWNNLESLVRQWAERDSALIIATGPILGDSVMTIGECQVRVPQGFYKVLLAHKAAPPRAIGFIYPNLKPTGKIADHAVTVDSVEAATGIDFFAALPDDIESAVESQCDFKQWNYRPN